MKLLIKYPCKGRLPMLKKNLKELKNNIKNPETKIILSIDKDDKEIYSTKSLTEIKPYVDNVKIMLSNSHNKINALNRDLDSLEWDYVLFLTDYTEIVTEGFDQWIIDNIKGLPNYPSEKTALKIRSKNNNGLEYHYLYVVPYHFFKSKGYVFNPNLAGNFHYELLEKELKDDYCIITDSITENSIHKYVHPKWGYYTKDELSLKSLNYWKTDLKYFEDEVGII
jgi:hypothetical protein